jgi:E-phenylitaconyl-CoA hydratase
MILKDKIMPVEYEKQGRIAVITLNRPDALNAIDPEMADCISAALNNFMNDESLWVGVITGAGNAFSVGADVSTTIPKLKESQHGQYLDPVNCIDGENSWKPLIAALNGSALGGGLELALLCDIRIAAENAMFGFPEVSLGIIPGWGGTQRITRAISLAIAAEMLFTGRPLSSTRALQVGLVNKVVPRADVLTSAMTMAENICKSAPLAVRAARKSMLTGLDMSLNNGLSMEKSLNVDLVKTEDFDEGYEAHVGKRKPIFKAR